MYEMYINTYISTYRVQACKAYSIWWVIQSCPTPFTIESYGAPDSTTLSFFWALIYFLQLGLRTIWEKYYEEAHGVLFVVDAAGRNRFEDAKGALG